MSRWSPTSADHDGGVARPRLRKSSALNGRAPALPPSRGKSAAAGVGAQSHLRYCPTCGAKRRHGRCPRGHDA